MILASSRTTSVIWMDLKLECLEEQTPFYLHCSLSWIEESLETTKEQTTPGQQ
jgi:hypothetical protein